jgi:hypothetical protein
MLPRHREEFAQAAPTVEVWDGLTGEVRARLALGFEGPKPPAIWSMDVSPDGARLIAGGSSGFAFVVDVGAIEAAGN